MADAERAQLGDERREERRLEAHGPARVEHLALLHEQPQRAAAALSPAVGDRPCALIVNNAAVVGWRAQAEQCHYAAAKAGVMALTRCAAIEAAEHGININAVAPSIAMHAFLEKVSDPDLLDDLASGEAFGRAAEPWEVANVMVFLASDLAGYMTGEIVSVSSQRP